MYSASAFAANAIVRCAVAAAFPLFTIQMFTNASSFSFCLTSIDDFFFF